MTGKRYYLAHLDAWQRHAHRCAESHFIVLDVQGKEGSAPTGQSQTGETGMHAASALILALIIADEAAHVALESDAACEALPHPLSRTPVSERVAAALAPFGVAAGDDTFTVAEKLARVNPLLRHRVF